MAAPLGQKFNPRLFAETLDRVRQGTDYGQDNIRPTFDPALHRDVVDDARHGRKVEDYKQCLDAIGFRFKTPAQLGPFSGPGGGIPRTEGEWVLRSGSLRLNMTSDEIVAWFASPEDLWNCVERWKLEQRAEAAGLVLPPKAR